MTDTTHNRAIANELRNMATAVDVLLGSVTGDEIRTRADELEAAAPPATIDADYTGDEPPVGTILRIATTVENEVGTAWDAWYHYDDGWGCSGDSAWYGLETILGLAEDGFPVEVIYWPPDV